MKPRQDLLKHLLHTSQNMARRSSRPSTTPVASTNKRPRTTPTKSQYFSDAGSAPSSPSTVEGETSGYEDEDQSASEPTSADEESDAFSESDAPPRKKQKPTSKSKTNSQAAATPTSSKATTGQELWREGVKTGLAPGTQVVIEKPKARAPGKTPYQDHTIHPNTMLFLADLVKNNDREWLKNHDPDYRTSWSDFTSWLESLQERLIESDETIPELPTKDIVFRIYRDIRFSKDPTPYKAHFSAAWSRTGRKGPYAAYYVQIKPGGCFVGGGLWHPEAAPIAKLRRDIDRKPHKIKGTLLDEGLRKEFLGGVSKDEKKAIKAFTAQNADNALKSKPKGFDGDHPNIDLLRLKNFTIGHRLKDGEVLGEAGRDHVAYLLSRLKPFVGYLNSVVMPDEEPSSSEDEDDEDEDDAEEQNG